MDASKYPKCAALLSRIRRPTDEEADAIVSRALESQTLSWPDLPTELRARLEAKARERGWTSA